LTDEEINLAVEQSGIVENQQAVLPANTPQHQTIVPAQALEKGCVDFCSRIFNIAKPFDKA